MPEIRVNAHISKQTGELAYWIASGNRRLRLDADSARLVIDGLTNLLEEATNEQTHRQ